MDLGLLAVVGSVVTTFIALWIVNEWIGWNGDEHDG